MTKDIKQSDYYFMFQTSGVPLLFSDFCIRYFLSFDGVIYQRNNQYMQYLRNGNEEAIQSKYRELYKNPESVETFYQQFESTKKEILAWWESVKDLPELSLEEVDKGSTLFGANEVPYSYVDPIYTDLLFSDESRDTEALKTLVLEKKNLLRAELNEIFFTESSPYVLFQKKLALQTGLSFKDLSYLSIAKLREVVSGKPHVDLYKGNLDYAIVRENDTYTYYFGSEATELIAQFEDKIDTTITELKGVSVSKKGVYQGKVRKVVIDYEDFEGSIKRMDTSGEGYVLVADATIPELVPLMTKAIAIVTNVGGLLSHAAITSRELGIPCVVGTKSAAEVFKEGDLIEVDANTGIVRKI